MISTYKRFYDKKSDELIKSILVIIILVIICLKGKTVLTRKIN